MKPTHPSEPSYTELVLVCGPPRSGTTWLNRELCNAPGAFPFLPECSYLTQQIGVYHRTRHYADRQRMEAYFGTAENLLNYFRWNVANLIEQAAKLNPRDNARTLVLKDPELCLYLVDLNELLPPHKLVVLVRDPRDVLASMKNVTARKKQPWDIEATGRAFLNYYYQIGNHHQRGEKNCVFVRYEDLVAGCTSQLTEFLGFSPISLAEAAGSLLDLQRRLDRADPFYSDLYLKPTTSVKVGSYADALERSELRYVEKNYAAIFRQWGYPQRTTLRSAIGRLLRDRLTARPAAQK